jgi:hypothetical protein
MFAYADMGLETVRYPKHPTSGNLLVAIRAADATQMRVYAQTHGL